MAGVSDGRGEGQSGPCWTASLLAAWSHDCDSHVGAKTVLTINRQHGILFMYLKCVSFVSFPGSDVHHMGHCR